MAKAASLLERRLSDLDAAIAAAPAHAQLHYLRAVVLADLGRIDDARVEFLAVIAMEPTHFGALNDLGTLLYRTDFRAAARLTYAEAVRHHPSNPIGRINLGNALLANGETGPARAQFEAALQLDPQHPDAHQGLANLFQQDGLWEEAEAHRQQSYRTKRIVHHPFLGSGEACRVLLLVSAVGGNVPTRFILDEHIFAVTTIVVEAWPLTEPLPAHDVVFNAIGDADICAPALEMAEALLINVSARIINPPRVVLPTSRAANAERLADLPNLLAPIIIPTTRAECSTVARSLGFPLLIRSPGFHTGQHFCKVDEPGELASASMTMPTDALLAIQYLDASDAFGQSRKYRVMMIDGALYPLHLAVSEHWKVHYFTAAMAERPEHRREEAVFLENMAGAIGAQALAALQSICSVLDLDYCGVDFGLANDGRLLLFEANATMVINPPGPDAIWDYRRGPVDRAIQAARRLVLERAGKAPDRAPQIG